MRTCVSSYGNRIKLVRLIVLSIVLGVTYFIYWSAFAYFQSPQYVFVNENVHSACVIPDIDPFDKETLRKYFWHPEPIRCDPNPSWVVVGEDGIVRFNASLEERINRLNVKCSYSEILSKDDNRVQIGVELPLKPPMRIKSDFFLVTCRISAGKTLYKNLHHQIVKKAHDDNIPQETEEDLSVILFGVDSLSRLSAIRKLPKTVEYLTKKLSAYVLRGYNKVGENTFPNHLALLTGRSENQLHIDTTKDHCEKLPLIWKNYSQNGHVTFLAEDWPEIATLNQIMRKGFSRPPCDHYMRPFFLAMRKINPNQHDLDMIFQFLEYQSVKLTKYSSLCYGNTPVHRIVIDYYIEFLKSYKNKRKFSFSWLNELGHNFVNFFELGDDDFLHFVKFAHDEGHLKNAVLLFFGDHGNRVDEIRNSYVGRIEDRMPFISIVLPDHVKRKYPHLHETLLRNQYRLTTPYDVFQMLSDILHKRFHRREPATGPGPISLFTEIPETRSCLEAEIPDRHCACYTSKSIQTTDPLVRRMADFVIEKINKILKNVRDKCHVISLKSISSAFFISSHLKWRKGAEGFNIRNWIGDPEDQSEERYMVLLTVSPNNATYETTVYRNLRSGELRADDEDISRISKFGNTSACMTERKLKDYCYCKDQKP